jgi:hypothetical protein
VFVITVIPVLDARRFADTDTHCTTVPYWPDPCWGNEFVRGMGALRSRPRRGVAPWIGESHFVDARRGVRLVPPGAYEETRLLQPVYRRYYCDGQVGRLELGFRTPAWHWVDEDQAVDVDGLVTAATHVRVKLAGHHKATPIIDLGRALGPWLLAATTRAGHGHHPELARWLRAGTPAVIVEAATSELAVWEPAWSGDRADWSVEDQLRQTQDPGAVLVEQHWQDVDQKHRTSIWALAAMDRGSWKDAREVRVHALRLHSEVEAMRIAVRLGDQLPSLQESRPFRDFVADRLDFLLRPRFNGLPQRRMLEVALDTVHDAYEEELRLISGLSPPLGRGLGGQLDDLGRVLDAAGAPAGAGRIVIVVTRGGILNMNDNSVSVTGGTVGNVQGGQGNQQHVESITISADTSRLVEELVGLVRSLAGALPPEQVAEGTELAEAVQAEAAATADPSRLRSALDRVKGWAESVGEVAVPVLATVAAIAKSVGLA